MSYIGEAQCRRVRDASVQHQCHRVLLSLAQQGGERDLPPRILEARRYRNEFAGRDSNGPLDTEGQVVPMAKGVNGEQLTYAGLIGPAFTPQLRML